MTHRVGRGSCAIGYPNRSFKKVLASSRNYPYSGAQFKQNQYFNSRNKQTIFRQYKIFNFMMLGEFI